MHTDGWAFLGAKTVFAKWFSTASRIWWLLTYLLSTVRTADQHGSRRKHKGQISKSSLCKIPNQVFVIFTEIGFCVQFERDLESAPHQWLLTGHFAWPHDSHQDLQDSCKVSWANYWRIPVDENAPNSTGFLWHPLLASPDIQSWLLLPA